MLIFQMQRINYKVSKKHGVLLTDTELCFLQISTLSALIYGQNFEDDEAFLELSQMKNIILLHYPVLP